MYAVVVQAPDTSVLIAFVEPESDFGAALASGSNRTLCRLAREVALLHRSRHPRSIQGGRVHRFLREQLGSPRLFVTDEFSGNCWAISLSFHSWLSVSIGIPVRPYILWLRLQRASGLLMGGATIWEAAHPAGFSDAAHLPRACRRMVGTASSKLVRRLEAAAKPSCHTITMNVYLISDCSHEYVH